MMKSKLIEVDKEIKYINTPQEEKIFWTETKVFRVSPHNTRDNGEPDQFRRSYAILQVQSFMRTLNDLTTLQHMFRIMFGEGNFTINVVRIEKGEAQLGYQDPSDSLTYRFLKFPITHSIELKPELLSHKEINEKKKRKKSRSKNNNYHNSKLPKQKSNQESPTKNTLMAKKIKCVREFVKKVREKLPDSFPFKLDDIMVLEILKNLSEYDLFMMFESQNEHCHKCGRCCKLARRVSVSEEELRRIAEYLEVSYVELLNNLQATPNGEFFNIPAGPCPFLRDNLCSINPVKPEVCSDFPMLSSIINFRKKEPFLFSDCPAIIDLYVEYIVTIISILALNKIGFPITS